MNKEKTDLQTMTRLDRRITCQGITQAVIVSGADPKDWEALVDRGVKVTLRMVKKIDPLERKKKANGKVQREN